MLPHYYYGESFFVTIYGLFCGLNYWLNYNQAMVNLYINNRGGYYLAQFGIILAHFAIIHYFRLVRRKRQKQDYWSLQFFNKPLISVLTSFTLALIVYSIISWLQAIPFTEWVRITMEHGAQITPSAGQGMTLPRRSPLKPLHQYPLNRIISDKVYGLTAYVYYNHRWLYHSLRVGFFIFLFFAVQNYRRAQKEYNDRGEGLFDQPLTFTLTSFLIAAVIFVIFILFGYMALILIVSWVLIMHRSYDR
ncbi:MAG: hypothetical protein Q4D58_04975 [Synergistaceae bacterium]|nr:hypothetical protein [Synergistaceae bacterium]